MRIVFISFLVTFTGKWEERSAKLPRLLGGRRAARKKTNRTGSQTLVRGARHAELNQFRHGFVREVNAVQT